MGRTLRVLGIAVALLLLWVPVWAQVPGRMVLTSPDGTREVEVTPGQAIIVSCPDGTCTGGGGAAAAVDLTKIGGVVLGGANVIDVPNTAFRVNCVVGCSSSSFTDNSAFTFGTTSINIAGYVFDDVAPNAVTENRAAAPRMSGNRVPYSILRDAAGNERGANVNASNELKVSLGDIIGVESAVTVHSSSLQIGGTTAPGGEWHAATITNIQPGASAYGLVVRDGSALSVNSGALNTTGYGINAYSRSDSLVHSMESRDSTPLGSEYALLTRNIPSGTQAISGNIGLINLTQLNNTIPNPTLSLQIGGAQTDGGTHRHVGAGNGDPSLNDVGLFVRNITAVGGPGSAAPGLYNLVAGRDPVTNAIRQHDLMTSAPTGTENGLVVRNIPSGTQAISAASLPLPTGAATSALQTQPGVDIGDVTVNNAGGAAAVNIQDGGNSLTIDASSLPLPTGAATEVTQLLQATAVKQSDGSQKTQIVDAAGNVVATATAAPAPGTRGLVGWVSQGGPWTADVTGNVAHGVADIGSPVKIGCRARGTIAAVAGDARVDLYCDTFGRPQVTSVPTYTPQTANGPATFSVGVASAQALAANASRKGVIIVNVSAAKVCLGIAAAAVIDSGICLQPDASLSLLNGSFDGVPTGAINAIAASAASSISIQEFQ